MVALASNHIIYVGILAVPGSFIKNLDCYWPTSEAVIKSDLTLFELLDPTIVWGLWSTVGHTV